MVYAWLVAGRWPSIFTNKRPNSLYNTMFSRTALAFFEARKLLLEKLVLRHKLNVLHLDADTVRISRPHLTSTSHVRISRPHLTSASHIA